MNLKRHHVLYVVLAVSLMIAILVFLTPGAQKVSFIGQQTVARATSTASSITQPMRFEIVTTSAQQERGLGGRSDIPENYGMLFVFPQDQKYGFWMKDMRVPIDIIWLADDATILKIEDSISPDTYPQIVYPPQAVRLVLETRAGEARRRGWAVGTRIELPAH